MVFYINLDHRNDRRILIEQELDNMNIIYERYSACLVKYPFGYMGCTISHIGVLKLAKERGYKNIIIFEDDFKFIVDSDTFRQMINDFFVQHSDYNVAMLSYNLATSPPLVKINNLVSEAESASTTSGYIVNHTFYDDLINTFSDTLFFAEKTLWNGFALDQMWKVLQGAGSKFYIFNTRIGVQRASISDCGNGIYIDSKGQY